ncbi:hypothetical protein ACT4US_32185, partial [Bacillus sp. HC-Mk]
KKKMDVGRILTTLLEIGSEDIQVLSSEDKVKSELPILVESETNYQSGYPDYHRSPRIIYREPEEKMTIAKPSSIPSKYNTSPDSNITLSFNFV